MGVDRVVPARDLRSARLAGLLWGLGALAACGGAASRTSIENGAGVVRVEHAPERVVALNQSAAEVLLTLGLGGRIVATGFQDNAIPQGLAGEYAAIPVHWSGYPTAEQFTGVHPDFAYATFASAFNDDLGAARDVLRSFGIEIYLSPWAIGAGSVDGGRPSFDPIARELREVSELFKVEARGREVIADLRARLDTVRRASRERPGPAPVVVWWVMGEERPEVAAGQGVLQLATEAARAINPFDRFPGSSTHRTWAEFVAADPNWIGLVDQASSPAASKRAILQSRPETAELRAVREGRFFVVPFSATVPGVGVAGPAEALAEVILADIRTAGRPFGRDEPR